MYAVLVLERGPVREIEAWAGDSALVRTLRGDGDVFRGVVADGV